jgi:hypothetical protein
MVREARPRLIERQAGVDGVQEQPRPLEVGQEGVAEADALGRALEQPGTSTTVSWAPSPISTVPEDGVDRRERVVGDLGRGVRQAPQQARLADVREPEQRRVGQQLQPQLEDPLVAVLPTSATRGLCRVAVA